MSRYSGAGTATRSSLVSARKLGGVLAAAIAQMYWQFLSERKKAFRHSELPVVTLVSGKVHPPENRLIVAWETACASKRTWQSTLVLCTVRNACSETYGLLREASARLGFVLNCSPPNARSACRSATCFF